ncbi:MAG: HD domain-containing protein [Candidatus Zixiibacteriota bacterium]|nr:MAG: HD domain-containing protein [candidate division Zixibacteria bacterium]
MNGSTILDGYAPVSLEVMRLDCVPGFDLYIVGSKGLVLYREKNVPFTLKNLKMLLENNVRYLYFKTTDESKYFDYIEDNLASIVEDKNVSPSKKASLIYDSSAHLAQQLISEPDSRKVVQRASKVMDTIVSFTASGRDAYKDIIRMLPSDYYTHTHSANVATYSLALGQVLGLTVNSGLWELTLGALLHDIGKTRVPREILNKNGPLSRQEFETVKQHVQWGVEIASQTRSVPHSSMPAIAQHHERISGKGYPYGIKEMHQFGKIVAVADSFDAMTTNRAYAKARSSFEAILILKTETTEFDKNIINALIEVMADEKVRVNR